MPGNRYDAKLTYENVKKINIWVKNLTRKWESVKKKETEILNMENKIVRHLPVKERQGFPTITTS